MFRVRRWQLVGVINMIILSLLPASIVKADANQFFSNLNNTFYSQIIINDCFFQTKRDFFEKSLTSQPWEWLGKDSNLTEKGVYIGRFVAPGSGHISCANQSVMGPAMTAFLNYAKYADIDAFVRELGYTVINRRVCTHWAYNAAGNATCETYGDVEYYSLEGRQPNMAAIQNFTPTQGEPALYYALNVIFARDCISTSTTNFKTVTRKVIVEEPANSKQYVVKDVSVNLKTAGTNSISANLPAYNYNNQNTNCEDLSKRLDSLTDAVIAHNKRDPENAITTNSSDARYLIDNASEASSCTIEGVGWFICPVVNFLANIVDASYGLVSNLLVFNGFTSGDGSVAMRSAWEGIRNIANVLFVIGFLVIVFSQITSVGISNYGIKKLLPRLVVAAVLVNLSYTLCALAVDLSNLTGASMNGFFKGFKFDAMPQSLLDTGEGWAGIAGGILATGVATTATLYVGLSALLPALISAALSIVTAFLVLTLRQALLILLVVVSPLALVAMLLPNTQEVAKKWRSMFVTMLLIYPIIGLLFGASALASSIITNAAAGNTFVQIMGALVSVLPLAITPVLLKVSGGVLGRFGAIINNPNRGPFDRLRKGAEGVRKRSLDRKASIAMQGGRVLGGSIFRRMARTKAINRSLERSRDLAEQTYIAKQIKENPGFAQRMAGGSITNPADASALQRAIASAEFTIDQATAENIKAATVSVRDLDAKSLKDIVTNSSENSEEKRAAAMQRLITISDPDDYMEAANNELRSGSEVMRRYTAEALSKTNLPLKASDIDLYATGQHIDQSTGEYEKIQDIIKANIARGVVSETAMVRASSGELKFIWDKADIAGRQRLKDTSNKLLNNAMLKGEIRHNIDAIEGMATIDVNSTFSNGVQQQ